MFNVWQAHIVDEQGNVLPNASVEVRRQSDLALVSIYDDVDGVTPLSNPMTADSEGFAQFYVAAGIYRIVATSGAVTRTWSDVIIGIPVSALEASATSVLGNATLTDPDTVSEIQASANDVLLRRTGDVVNFGQLTVGMVPDNILTLSKLEKIGAGLLGNSGAGLGNVTLFTPTTSAAVLRCTAVGPVALSWGQLSTDYLDAHAVTDAKLRVSAATSVIGRFAGTAGDVADITATADNQVLRRTGGVLGFGSIPDGALSANVALLNADPLTLTGRVVISSASPELDLLETDATANNGGWYIAPGAEQLQFGVYNDARSVFTAYMSVDRTGTVVDQVTISASAKFSTAATFAGEDVFSNAGDISIYLVDTSQGADEKRWRVLASGGSFIVATRTDANGVGATALQIDRTGTAIDLLTVSTAVDISGKLVVGSTVGGNCFALKPGAADHCYMEIYSDSAAPTTRYAYFGAASAGTSDITLAAERGNLLMYGDSGIQLDANGNVVDINGIIDNDQGVSMGGGSTATLGTIGGSGPAAAGQNNWLHIKILGDDRYIPVWA